MFSFLSAKQTIFTPIEMEDEMYQPPSEMEQQRLQRARERSNKISKILGDYLLKGYKMLGTTCNKCGTILLEDRQGEDYCVGCTEVFMFTYSHIYYRLHFKNFCRKFTPSQNFFKTKIIESNWGPVHTNIMGV